MKSLDINTASTNFGAYDSRRILIEFTGGHFTERLQGAATHTVIVPYSSLSRKLQTIQRLGSKIINVSIHSQPEVLQVNPENAAPEKISELNLEDHHELPSNKSTEQSITETLESEVLEVAEIASGTFPEVTLQPIVEIANKEVSETNSETISAAPQVVTPKKKKASTKASQGFSKQDSSPKVQAPIAIAETTTVSEQVLEPESEIVVEPISATILESIPKPIPEEILPTLSRTETQEPITPSVKAKAPRNSSKSGLGFNKSKRDTKSPRSPKQPKS
jgi:hypothetical protein